MKKIQSAIISVFNKDKLEKICHLLSKNNIKIYSTGGTYDFISKLGVKSEKVEDLTSYPSILMGRVKTLHPKIHAGILNIRSNKKHNKRRLINPTFLEKLVMRTKKVYFLSDNYDYYLNVKSSALKLKKAKIFLSSKKFKTANTKYLQRAKRLRNKLYYLTIDKE